MSKGKIGDGHANAMARQGLKELRAAFYPESNVAQPTEYGTFGTKTPGEIAEERRVEVKEHGEEPHTSLADRLEQAERAGHEPEPEPPEPEME